MRRRWRHAITATAAALLVGVLAACEPPVPVTFTVTSATDAVDVTPGDGSCADAAGECTLRAAIQEANATAAATPVVVELAVDATYTLTVRGAENAAASGDLDVRHDITVEGHGSTIDSASDPFAFLFRLIEHHEGRLVLRDLGLVGGGAEDSQFTGAGIDGTAGGAILNWATLELEDVAISGARTFDGGSALHQAAGSTLLRRTEVRGNSTKPAAVWIQSGDVVLIDSAVTRNPSNAGDASLDPDAIRQDAGRLVLIASTVSGNSAFSYVCSHAMCGWVTASASAIDASGDVTIIRSTVHGSPFALRGPGDVEVGGSVISACDGVAATSLGYNRVVESDCLGALAAGDVVAGVLFGPLGYNGGPTENHVPPAGTTQVDAIPPGTPKLCDGSLVDDQRGMPQPVGAGCDAGSTERQLSDP